MKIAIGSDHAGFALKKALISFLSSELGCSVLDVGTDSEASADYPDFAFLVAQKVKAGEVRRGIMICGSGVGATIAANKVEGIRASTCHDTYSAHQGVEHDHMNILVLGSRVVGIDLARELVAAFVRAKESQEERHLRRLSKVDKIEKGHFGLDMEKSK